MVGMTDTQLAAVRWRDLSVVMQSAMNALNPVKSIGAQFKDAMKAHGVRSADEIAGRSAEVLRMVGIDPVHLKSYPHQLSGGMRQRSMIAMALLFTPDLVIMDEPTSALDVVAQRSLMVQIRKLQEELGFAVIFVTHDMSLVSHFSQRLMVMYAGQVAEWGPTRQVFDNPRHPYSIGLLEAFPSIRGERVPLTGIPGRPPDLSRPQQGCWFAARCPKVMDTCQQARPVLYQRDGVLVRCLLYADETAERASID
jgi:peptide/nickel transport system ATP-binding protein